MVTANSPITLRPGPGRPKGLKKTGGATRGSIKTHTNEVKQAVLRVFNELNEGDEYLRRLAVEDQRLFLSLLARLMPTAVDVEIKHQIDLGAAMSEANARLEEQTIIIENT